MSEFDVGANRHVWETRYAELEEELAADPVEPLPELAALVGEMLTAAGYVAGDEAGADPEVAAVVERARELVELREAGEEVRHDDAQQAVAGLRELYRGLLEHPEADARADLGTTGDGFALPDRTEA